MSTFNPLARLHILDTSSADFPNQVVNLFRDEEYRECIPSLQSGALVWLVKFLDNVHSCVLIFGMEECRPSK